MRNPPLRRALPPEGGRMFVEQLQRAVEASPRVELAGWRNCSGGPMGRAKSPRPRRRRCRKPSSRDGLFRPLRSPSQRRLVPGHDPPLAWNAAAVGPLPALCRLRSPAGSRWPNKPSWPWSRPSTRNTARAPCRLATSLPWSASLRPRCAMPAGGPPARAPVRRRAARLGVAQPAEPDHDHVARVAVLAPDALQGGGCKFANPTRTGV